MGWWQSRGWLGVVGSRGWVGRGAGGLGVVRGSGGPGGWWVGVWWGSRRWWGPLTPTTLICSPLDPQPPYP